MCVGGWARGAPIPSQLPKRLRTAIRVFGRAGSVFVTLVTKTGCTEYVVHGVWCALCVCVYVGVAATIPSQLPKRPRTGIRVFDQAGSVLVTLVKKTGCTE